jgi:hypothetical protein
MEEALDRDVEPHRLGDRWPEPSGQPVGAGVAVPVVGAAQQIAAGVRTVEVADVVQQRRGDEGVRGSGGGGECGGLSHVSGLAHRFVEVVRGALPLEQLSQDVDRISLRQRGAFSRALLRRRGPASP